MTGSNASRAKGTMTALSLAMIVALLVAAMFATGVAEAKGGGRGGGGGGGKPSGISSGKPSSDSSYSSSSAPKSSSSGLYNPSYGARHGSLSNFFLWAWIFHDFDDDDYEEEYGESNTGFGDWAIMGVGAIGIWFLIRNLRRRFVS